MCGDEWTLEVNEKAETDVSKFPFSMLGGHVLHVTIYSLNCVHTCSQLQNFMCMKKWS